MHHRHHSSNTNDKSDRVICRNLLTINADPSYTGSQSPRKYLLENWRELKAWIITICHCPASVSCMLEQCRQGHYYKLQRVAGRGSRVKWWVTTWSKKLTVSLAGPDRPRQSAVWGLTHSHTLTWRREISKLNTDRQGSWSTSSQKMVESVV